MANNDKELQDGCHRWLPLPERFGEHATALTRRPPEIMPLGSPSPRFVWAALD